MLVNASRFTGVQGTIRDLVQELIDDIGASVRLNAGLVPAKALLDPEMKALHQAWEEEYPTAGVGWDAVQSLLLDSVSPIRVVEVNSKSHGTLNYSDYVDTGMSVIAVGGYSLSRGLTLSGLMVSYFLRNSVMYDTLMQMGRWFGYRHDYEDLCRVWMPEEAEGWYAHVAESIELLRDDLRLMAAANATPADFGLKVRAHPDTLLVTARNKMGAGEKVVVSISLEKAFVETAALRRDSEALIHNRNLAKQLAEQLTLLGYEFTSATTEPGGYLLRGVPADLVLGFLAAYRNSPVSLLTEPGPVTRYIQRRKLDELKSWDLMLASTSVAGAMTDTTFGITVNCQRRSAGTRSDRATIRVTNKQRVSSRGIEKTGLPPSLVDAAQREYEDHHGPARDGTYNYPDYIYRSRRDRPLLIIHLLHLVDGVDKSVSLLPDPVVAWSLALPGTAIPEDRVEYVVTRQWQRENMPQDYEDQDDEDDDPSS